ncbi:MAG: SDR family oxidoreductase [Promethearchaeota archaeon]|nr:MAG: SDR family oxidoreductase [Candidatus Lokiarchaeota archaeon]
MRGKNVMITGANSGIGKQTGIDLAKMGATIIMIARNKERAFAALEEIKEASKSEKIDLFIADLSDQDSIRSMVKNFKKNYKKLDVLINNAGIMLTKRRSTKEGYEMTLATNHLGHFLLTSLLLQTLIKSAPARIINVSSVAHKFGNLDFDDLQLEENFNGLLAYGNSKLANIMFTYALARHLEGTGVTVNALHPGTVKTNFGKRNESRWSRLFFKFLHLFFSDVKKGAKTSVYLASSPEIEEISGKYFVKSKLKKSSRASYDEEVQEKLWTISEKLTHTSYTQLLNEESLIQPTWQKKRKQIIIRFLIFFFMKLLKEKKYTYIIDLRREMKI